MEYQITNKDRALLQLIAKGEATQGSDPYISVYPGSTEPALVQMTLAEVQEYQRRRINSGYKSSAVGKYQFIKATLKECIGYLGADPVRVKFTPDIQDALIIERLKKIRKYDSWMASPPDDEESTAQFMISLAREFASVPVPYDMVARGRQLRRGQSYYAGDGLNKAHHDPGAFFLNLTKIKKMEGETVALVDTAPSSEVNGAPPPVGRQTQSRAIASASGVGVGSRIGRDPGDPDGLVVRNLPDPNPKSIFTYRMTDPLDNRYDFRTGEKVNNLLKNGLNSKASVPEYTRNNSPAGTPIVNAGAVSPLADPNKTYTADDIDNSLGDSLFTNWENVISEVTNRDPDTQLAEERPERTEPTVLSRRTVSTTDKTFPRA